MAYLVDTDVLSSLLAGDEDVGYVLQAMAEESLAISVVTYKEAYEGAYYGTRRRLYRERFASLARELAIVPLSEAAARRCARLRATLRGRGSRVRGRALDVINAAIALEHRLTLVTRNLNDYKDIPGVKLYLGQESK